MSNDLDEFSVIEHFFRPLIVDDEVALGFGDDAARFCVGDDEEIVVSKDLMLEDVHFFRRDGGFNIGSKLLRVNLSDLAASGARPLYYMLGFSKGAGEDFLREFCAGLKDAQDEFGLSLIGGDTVRASDKLCFSLTIFGVRKKGANLARKNAQDADLIFVSGEIGAAHLGFLQNSGQLGGENGLKAYFAPCPRVDLGVALLKNGLSDCAIDVSDGFLADLRHICKASNLDGVVFLDKIPMVKELDFKQALSGGEDYELIFTVKKEDKNSVLELAKKLKISLTCVGYMKKSQNSAKVRVLDGNNNEILIEKYGYRH